MFDGFLKDNSKDLGRIQIFLDPFVITFLFNFFFAQDSNLIEFQYIRITIFFITYIVLSTGNIYESYRHISIFSIIIKVLKTWFCLFALILFLESFILSSIFLNSFIIWAFFSLIFLLINHVGLRFLLRIIRKYGRNSRNLMFYGSYESLQIIRNEIKINSWLGIKLVAWFSNQEELPKDKNISFFCNGGIEEMKKWLINNSPDYIVFSESYFQKVSELLEIFGDFAIPVYFLPPWKKAYINLNKIKFGSESLLEIWGNNKSFLDLRLKRFFDIVFSILILIILSPVFLLTIAILIFDKNGPIFYKQNRYGLNGKKFKIYKFRSMNVIENSREMGITHTKENDTRVTLFGKFIRKWSIDELPQLFNVLMGEMSLVGPRPHATNHNEYYRKLIPGYMQRYSVKPGMTGLAQVEGWRGDIKDLRDMRKRVNADLRYHENWSIYLDIKILFLTIFSLRGT